MPHRTSRLLILLFSPVLALLVALAAQAATIVHSTVPGISDSMIILPDGSLLFNDNYAGTLSRLFPETGEITIIELPVPQTRNPTLGNDGRIWFTVDSARQIGRYSIATGLLDIFPLPASISGSFGGMALGLDGSLWATASDSNRILRIYPTGVMATYDIASYDAHPVGITQGPDGNMWFAEENAKKIGRITLGGAVTEFAVQYPLTTGPTQIVHGADGAMWFATHDGFGRVAIDGEMIPYPTGPQSATGRMVLAPDGSFFLSTGDGYITQFSPPAQIHRLFIWDQPAHSAGMVFDASGSLWVVDSQLRQHSRLARISGAAISPGDTTVVEFYNSGLKHYFITANPEEAAGIDAGAAGPGWSRTGESWQAWLVASVSGTTEVCRFYGNPAVDPATGLRRGPNSHFYTFVGPECEQVKGDKGWVYEAPNRFFAVQPTQGSCAAGLAAVYRSYNSGFATNDSNHRYTVKQSIYDQMTGQGWKGEGVVMCAAP